MTSFYDKFTTLNLTTLKNTWHLYNNFFVQILQNISSVVVMLVENTQNNTKKTDRNLQQIFNVSSKRTYTSKKFWKHQKDNSKKKLVFPIGDVTRLSLVRIWKLWIFNEKRKIKDHSSEMWLDFELPYKYIDQNMFSKQLCS